MVRRNDQRRHIPFFFLIVSLGLSGCGSDAIVDDRSSEIALTTEEPTSYQLAVQPERRTRDQNPSRYLPDWDFAASPGTYRYSPTVMDHDGRWRMWTCGGGRSPRPGGGWQEDGFFDRIEYQEWGGGQAPLFLNSVIRAQKTLAQNRAMPLNQALAQDSAHSCAPSVVRHSHPNVFSGRPAYWMFYECASFYRDRSAAYGLTALAPVQICLAVSETGREASSWLKFKDGSFVAHTENPTPIIRATEQLSKCGFDPATHSIDKSMSTCNGGAEYGVGHPGAVLSDDGRIHVYFYDSASGKVNRWTTADGFTFPAAERLTLDQGFWSSVKRIENGQPDGKPLYLSFRVLDGNSYFAYSKDGLNFTRPTYPNPQTRFFIGTNQRGRCATGGKPTIVSDARGWLTVKSPEADQLHTFSANLFQGEGFLSKADGGERLGCYDPREDESRGSTWTVRMIPLDFSWIQD